MNRFQANICLITVLICWSFEVVLFKNIPMSVPWLAVMAMISFIGFAVLGLLFFTHIKRHFSFRLWRKVLLLALLNIAYNVPMMEAVHYLPTMTSVFAATASLLIMPFLLLLTHEKIRWQTWLGGGLVLMGIIFSLDWTLPWGQTVGLMYMGIHVIVWTIYLFLLNGLSKQNDPLTISALSLGSVSICSCLLYFCIDPQGFFHFEYSSTLLSSVFADGYFICAFATVINIYAQKYLTPLNTVAINALNPIINIILVLTLPSILLEKTELSPWIMVSCILVMMGSFVCEADWDTLEQRCRRRS